MIILIYIKDQINKKRSTNEKIIIGFAWINYN